MRHYLLIFFIVLLTTTSCTEKPKDKNYDLSIQNVSVIDRDGILWETPHTLYTKNGLIEILEPAEGVAEFSASKEINGTGKFLILGLWDNHAHFRGGENLVSQNEEFLERFLTYGITTVRDAGGDLTPQVQQWNREIQNGSRMGPNIYTSGPKLDGRKARWAGSLEISSKADIDGALDSLQNLDVDYVKLYDSTISGANYLEIIRRAEARDMITSGHMPFTVTLENAIDAGLDNVEHLYYILKGCSSKEAEITQKIRDGELGFWDSMAQLIASYDEETAQKTFKSLRDHNVYVTPTLHIGNILSYLDEIDHSKDTYLKYLSPEFLATYEGRNKSALNASPEARANRKELQKFFLKFTKSLSDSGVQLLAGSDSGAYNSYTYPGPSLHGELQQMVRAGLTPEQALKNSYNGASFLRIEGYRMEKGNQADLILLNTNPLVNIENTLDIYAVITHGVEVTR